MKIASNKPFRIKKVKAKKSKAFKIPKKVPKSKLRDKASKEEILDYIKRRGRHGATAREIASKMRLSDPMISNKYLYVLAKEEDLETAWSQTPKGTQHPAQELRYWLQGLRPT